MDETQQWYFNTIRPIYEKVLGPQCWLTPFTSNIAALFAIACHLDYRPLYFVGNDFTEERFKIHAYKNGKWEVNPYTEPEDNIGRVVTDLGNIGG